MHQSMHNGSIARAASALPQSSVSQPNWSRTPRAVSFAAASFPQMNIVGLAGSFGLTKRALPQLENAFTNLAAGRLFWSRSINDSLGPVMNERTPLTGGASAIGLVVSRTTLPF